MATTKKNTENAKDLNETLVNATKATINATIANGEKWQKLTAKLIKKSEPVRRKQMDLVFETATAVKKQVITGRDRVMDLVGYEQAVDYVTSNPVTKKVMEVSDDIKTKVSENAMVQQVGKTAETIKTKGSARIKDIQEDVLEQAQKILNKGEAMVEEALTTTKVKAPAKKAKVTTAKKTSPKAKATTATKAATKTTTRKTTAKATATKAAAPKATKAPAAKKAAPKATAKAEAPAAKAADNK